MIRKLFFSITLLFFLITASSLYAGDPIRSNKLVYFTQFNTLTSSYPVPQSASNFDSSLVSSATINYGGTGISRNDYARTSWNITNTSSTLDPATAPYVEYTINFNSSVDIDLDRFVITGGASNYSTKFELRWSKDNYASSLGLFSFGSDWHYKLSSVNLNTLSNFTGTQLKFRLYFYDTSASGSNFVHSDTGAESLDGTPESYDLWAATATIWVNPPPAIDAITPSSGAIGSTVVITGTDFTGATAVSFNGINAPNFVVDSPTQITATVPVGATTGPITVTTANGTGTSTTNFTVLPPPTITSFSPSSGPISSTVTITGSNFTGATAVSFNGITVTSFTVNSATSITATVPIGATTGAIAVTTPSSTVTSSSNYTVAGQIVLEYPFNNSLDPLIGTGAAAMSPGATATLSTTGICKEYSTGSGNLKTANVSFNPSAFQVDLDFSLPVLGSGTRTLLNYSTNQKLLAVQVSATGVINLSFTTPTTSFIQSRTASLVLAINTTYKMSLQYVSNSVRIKINGNLVLVFDVPEGLATPNDGTFVLGDVPPSSSSSMRVCIDNFRIITNPLQFAYADQLVVSPTTFNPFNTCLNSPSTAQTFTVSGTNLSNNTIKVRSPSQDDSFEISQDGTTYTIGSIDLSATAGTLNATTLYVRLRERSSLTSIGRIGPNLNTILNFEIGSTGGIYRQSIALSGNRAAVPTISGTNTILVGGTTTLTGSATAAVSLPWVSSNTSVATISSSGVVTGVAVGTTTITYTNSGGCQATYTVTVSLPPTITSFTPTTLSIGETVTITGTNFNNVTSVKIGTTLVTNFTVSSDKTSITAVTNAILNGPITIVCALGTVISSNNLNVTIGTTQSPTLISPTTGTSGVSTLNISYTLPEAPLANSVRLTFTPTAGGTPIVWTMTNATAATFAYPVGTNPTLLGPIATGSPLDFTTYDLTLSYQDVYGSPATSVTNTSIQILPPPANLSYSLPTTFTNGSVVTNIVPSITGTATSFSVSPALPTGLTLNTSTGVISGTPTVAATLTSYVVTATNSSGSTTYSLSFAIDKATPTIASMASINKTYGDVPFTLTAPTSNGTGAFTFTSTDTAVATILGTTVTIVGAGTATITATQATDANYLAGSTSTTLTVGKATPVLSNFNAITSTIDSPSFTLTAPTSSGGTGAISYTSSNIAVATISGATVTKVGVGTATITATQASDANYNSQSITALLTVGIGTTQPPTLISPATGTSGVSTLNISYTLPEAPQANSVRLTFTPTAGGTPIVWTMTNAMAATFAYPVGTNPTLLGSIATGSPLDFTTYDLTLSYQDVYGSPATLVTNTSIQILPPPANLSYSLPTTFTKDSVVTNIVPSITGTANSFSVSPALPTGLTLNTSTGIISGTPTVAATLTSYVVTATNSSGSTTYSLSFAVDKATPTIASMAAITKTYGDVPFTLTAPTSNGTGAFTFTSTDTAVATISGTTVTIVGAGTATITATQATDANYLAGSTSTTLTVGKATPVLSNFNAITSTIDSPSFTLTAPTSSGGTGAISYTSSNTTVATISGATVTKVGVGTATITATQASDANYNSQSITALLTVGIGTTQPPTLISPVTGTSGVSTLNISYTLPEAPQANSVRLTFTPTAGGTPIVWTMTNATAATFAYPVGTNPTLLGSIATGSPLDFTTYDLTLSYQDVYGSPASSVTNTSIQILAPPSITLANTSYSGLVNTVFTTITVTNTGGVVSSFAISPNLPTGLTLNTTTGDISGTPTTALVSTTYTITATNPAGTATRTFSLFIDADTDGDGVPDAVEIQQGTDPNVAGDALDTDGDGVPDYVEQQQGTNPNSNSSYLDTDGDGLSDYYEANNSAPTDISLTANTISENNAINAVIGNLGTTDVGDVFDHTYTLVSGVGSTDNASFSIVGNQIKAGIVFDFETKTSYSIRVKTTDVGGLSYEKVFTITVVDVVENVAPTNIALSTTSIAENNAVDAVVGALSSTDADSGDTHTYTLVSGVGSTDNASFSIVGNQIKAGIAFDFETKSNYSVRVKTTDAGGLSYEKVFTITVVDVVENVAPTNIALSTTSIAENNAVDAVVGALSSTDADSGDTHTYTLVSGVGSTDNASFSIVGNQIKAGIAFDFETKTSYSIRVKTTDVGGLSYEKVFTISVVDVVENVAPTNIALSTTSIAENNAVDAVVGALSSTDADSGDTHTYTLVSGVGSTDNASFSIVGNQIKAGIAFDFETKTSYSIRVKTTDVGGLSYEKVFTISVVDVVENVAPTNIALSTTSIAENNAVDAVVGALSSTDADSGDTHTYTLVSGVGSTDNASFSIVGNQIKAGIAFDFETKSSYSVRVKTTDAGGLSFEKVFTVTVTNVNETPILSVSQTTNLGVVGIPLTTITVTNSSGPVSSFAIAPALSAGLTFNTTTGAISGTPTLTMASRTYTISGTNSDGTGTVSFSLVIDQDTDKDGLLDSIDTDDDGDGIVDINDAFPTNPREWKDTDRDGTGDNTDSDDDNDGILDTCDVDVNGDGIPDNGTDMDGDGINDDCDTDKDGDGVNNTSDTCPNIANRDQADRDHDGLGDVCDTEELNVSEAITPNGDGINDTWMIYNIENHPNTTVRVFNRWGSEVFLSRDYKNDWDGHYNGSSTSLPKSASYLYQVDLNSDGTIEYSGWLYITK
jgi:gliding motility-associated-like protein